MIATLTTTTPSARTTHDQALRIALDPMALAAVRLVRPQVTLLVVDHQGTVWGQDRMRACWCTVHPAEGGLLVVPK
jgi:hypothetical protein